VGVAFLTTVTAKDVNGNTVTTNSVTVATLTGSGSAQFDSDGNSVFGDNTKVLSNGIFTISTRDNVAETMTLTASSAGGKTGTSSSITVNKGNQTITFPPIPTQKTTSRLGLSATADSGLPVSFALGSGPALLAGGTNLVFTGPGVVTVIASQAGDSNWNAATPKTNSFAVVLMAGIFFY